MNSLELSENSDTMTVLQLAVMEQASANSFLPHTLNLRVSFFSATFVLIERKGKEELYRKEKTGEEERMLLFAIPFLVSCYFTM